MRSKIAAGKLAGAIDKQAQTCSYQSWRDVNVLGSRLALNQQLALYQQSYSSEVRARLKITVTVQRADLARTFL